MMFPKPVTVKKTRHYIKPGKKTLEWEHVRKELKVEFFRLGITTCEVGPLLSGHCYKDNFLGFAHIDKRRMLSPGEIWMVVLACVQCHMIIENWPREKMRTFLLQIIKTRNDRLTALGYDISKLQG